jgi:hypothetical protein
MVTRGQDGEAMRVESAGQGNFNQIEAGCHLSPVKAIENSQTDCKRIALKSNKRDDARGPSLFQVMRTEGALTMLAFP